jgi:cytoskeletal protein CcmA (bactofilin family)
MTNLGQSIVVLGDIEAHDDLVIEGRVKGHVRSEQAAITVREGATITGDIVARAIVVAGQVTGTLTATERVEISETANVRARIISSGFVLRDGAVFNGAVHPQRVEPASSVVQRYRDAEAAGSAAAPTRAIPTSTMS